MEQFSRWESYRLSFVTKVRGGKLALCEKVITVWVASVWASPTRPWTDEDFASDFVSSNEQKPQEFLMPCV